MIVVTGATGHLGRQIVEGLATRVPASQIGLSVRDPEKARAFEQRGMRVVHGDFQDPSTLLRAFEGAEQVLIVSVNTLGEAAVRQHANAIQAARDASVKRILYTSHQAASLSSAVPFARDHATTEALLASSATPFVSLRNGFYAESALYQLGSIKATGQLALPEDGPVSWTARVDLAEAAIAALLNSGLFDGITPPLTAAEALTFADIARLASAILQRDLTRITVGAEDYRAAQLAHGYSETMVDMLASLFAATCAREFDVTDPTLAQILGRPPKSMSETLRAFFSPPGAKFDSTGAAQP